MSEIKEFLKQHTPLARIYWKMRKLPPFKQLLHVYHTWWDDRLLFHDMPNAYNAHRNEPIDENKVIFVELRLPELSNSFSLVYQELKDNYNFDIHVHFLRNTFVKKRVYRQNCIRLAEDLATAKYVFVCEASTVISCLEKRPETIVTQLWHACGAFKKFGKSTAELIFGPNTKELARHPINRNYNYVTVSSPDVMWAYEEAMELEETSDVIRPVGISRTDVFFREDFIEAAKERIYNWFPAARDKKIILYAPTFRGRVAHAKTPRFFDPELFYRAFGKEYVVITKHHPLVRNLPELPEYLEGTFIKDATRTQTIEDLLCVSDICISDYSSLIFEFSLFARPMLFFAPDLERYFDWRGFYYKYDELTPGPVCTTNEEMIDYISRLPECFDRAEVEAFRYKFMRSCDGHATERILELTMGKEKLAEMSKEEKT